MTWRELKEAISDAFLLISALSFLFLSAVLLTIRVVVITDASLPYQVVTTVVAVVVIGLVVKRLVRY